MWIIGRWIQTGKVNYLTALDRPFVRARSVRPMPPHSRNDRRAARIGCAIALTSSGTRRHTPYKDPPSKSVCAAMSQTSRIECERPPVGASSDLGIRDPEQPGRAAICTPAWKTCSGWRVCRHSPFCADVRTMLRALRALRPLCDSGTTLALPLPARC